MFGPPPWRNRVPNSINVRPPLGGQEPLPAHGLPGGPGAPAGLDSLSHLPCRRHNKEKNRKTIKFSY